MKLYEATNGMIGCSYVRCYVWANNKEEARQMATELFSEPRKVKIEFLFKNDSPPFCTKPSDEGWVFIL